MSSDSNRISLIIDTLTCPMTRQYYYEIRRQYESPIFILPDPTRPDYRCRVASADSQRLKTARRRKICSLDMFRASVQSNLVWRDANKQFRRVGSGGVNTANM